MTIDAKSISRSFKRKVSAGVKLETGGLNRFIVYTPFAFDDGDHYVVVLKKERGKWILTDEGHTLMHLSYGDIDLSSGTRSQVIERAIAIAQIENRSGELCLEIPDTEFGDSLFTFVQAISQIASTTFWTQERVRATFFEDVAELVQGTIPMPRVHRKYVDPVTDPDGKYPVDLMIDGVQEKKWFLFAVSNDVDCQQATITCYRFEKSKVPFSSIVLYQDQTNINRRFVAQLTDVSGKAFSSLNDRDRIKSYLETTVMGNGEPKTPIN
jgi:hypothetical protein